MTGSASLTTILRRTASIGRSASCTSPRTTPSSSRKRPSRSAILAASSGFAETSSDELPGLDEEARAEVPQRRALRRLLGRALGLGDLALDGEDAEHPLRADERASDLVDGFGGRAQRQHEERGVPVEGDEVADVDLPREREAGAEPGDEDDEEPGYEDLGRVKGRLRKRNADAGLPHLLRAVPVAVEERVLAADPAQHAQPGGGVRAESGQLPDLLALLGLPGLERLDHRPHQQHEHGHAEEDDEAERHRRGEQDDRDDDVRHDRAGEPRGDVEGSARAHRIARDRRHDLAGRVLLLDRVPGAGGVVCDDLRHAERGLEPVRDRETVPHDSCHGRRRAEREQDQRPDGERTIVVVDDSILDRAPDRGRHQRLRDHPEHAEQHSAEERPELLPPDPDEESKGERVSGLPGSAKGSLIIDVSAWLRADRRPVV